MLHRDGRWSHEGHPLTNRRLREAFDRSVRFLPAEGKYVVQLGLFRGEIEIEEAGFFVRSVDPPTASISLSDGTTEPLEPASLRPSPHDGAWLCRVKWNLEPAGIPARFTQAAWAQLLEALEETPEGPRLRLAGRLHPVPGG